MRSENYSLDVPASGVGSSRDCRQLHDKWIQVMGVGAAGATIQLEGSSDGGATWAPLLLQTMGSSPAAAITADDFYEMPQNVLALRVNRTVAGVGTVTVVLVGRMAHG